MKQEGLWMKYKGLRRCLEGLWSKIGIKNSIQHLPQEEAIAFPHAQKSISKTEPAYPHAQNCCFSSTTDHMTSLMFVIMHQH